jgi:hypothetical protein
MAFQERPVYVVVSTLLFLGRVLITDNSSRKYLRGKYISHKRPGDLLKLNAYP